MAAYVLGSIDVTDPQVYEEYRKQAPAVIAAHGGRYLVRGGASEVLEGASAANRLVVLEFPDMAHLQAFYRSPEYQRLARIRQSASTGSLIAVEGFSG